MATEKTERPESNADPITGAPGAHPIGVGLGAAAGGIAAGAAAGTLAAGPIGTVVGAAIGAVVGGLAGKGAAESMNPTAAESTIPTQDGLAAHREIDMRVGASEATTHGRSVAAVVRPSDSGARAPIDAGDGITNGRAGQSGQPQTINPYEEQYLPEGTESGASPGSIAGGGAAALDSSTEDAYWRATYRNQPYYSSSRSYDDYAPAYRLGHQRRAEYGGSYDASEQQLASEWERAKGSSRLTWSEAKQATKAAWNRPEDVLQGADHLPRNRVGESYGPLNPPPLSHGAFQGFAADALTPPADLVATNTNHLSDAADEARDQTTNNAAVAGNWDYAATSDHKGSEAMRALRAAVRSSPLVAIGVAVAFGFLLVGGRSLQRAVSRARWN
jgi:hypothetical protein